MKKHSDTFDGADAEARGTKRTLTALMRDLETRGHDVKKLRVGNLRTSSWATIVLYPHLARVPLRGDERT